MSTQTFSRILGMTYPAAILFLAGILAWSGAVVGEVPVARRLTHLPEIKIFQSSSALPLGELVPSGDLTLETPKSSLN